MPIGLHRLAFMTARAFAFLAFFFVGVMFLGNHYDKGASFAEYISTIPAIILAISPILILKFLIKARCPKCRGRLDRAVIATCNYDCERCGHSCS